MLVPTLQFGFSQGLVVVFAVLRLSVRLAAVLVVVAHITRD